MPVVLVFLFLASIGGGALDVNLVGYVMIAMIIGACMVGTSNK